MSETEPLASRIRPATLDEFVGQSHLVGEGKPLRIAVEQGHVFSFILWGTPGTGKTTLARIYANAINAEFYELSAVSAGKDDIRKIIASKPLPKTVNSEPTLFDASDSDSTGNKALTNVRAT